jgi:hypothetical protein
MTISRRTTSRGRGSRGRNSFLETVTELCAGSIRVTCWGCGGPHYQCDYPELQSGFVHREGKAPMARASSNH